MDRHFDIIIYPACQACDRQSKTPIPCRSIPYQTPQQQTPGDAKPAAIQKRYADRCAKRADRFIPSINPRDPARLFGCFKCRIKPFRVRLLSSAADRTVTSLMPQFRLRAASMFLACSLSSMSPCNRIPRSLACALTAFRCDTSPQIMRKTDPPKNENSAENMAVLQI